MLSSLRIDRHRTTKPIDPSEAWIAFFFFVLPLWVRRGRARPQGAERLADHRRCHHPEWLRPGLPSLCVTGAGAQGNVANSAMLSGRGSLADRSSATRQRKDGSRSVPGDN